MQLLRLTSLDTVRPLVAFDVLERNERKVKKSDVPRVEFSRCKDGDRHLFTAIDSSINAAFHWRDKDYHESANFAVLNVPVCVLSMPFWDVCIDGGKVAEPELRRSGYQTSSYPDLGVPSVELMALVWSSEDISGLVASLDGLFAWLCEEARRLPQFASLGPSSP
jgi:hypothetical protein